MRGAVPPRSTTAAGVNAPDVSESMAARGPEKETSKIASDPGSGVTSQRLASSGVIAMRTPTRAAV